jgi:hypothetical protein
VRRCEHVLANSIRWTRILSTAMLVHSTPPRRTSEMMSKLVLIKPL